MSTESRTNQPKISPKPPRGMRDLLPDAARRRAWVVDTMRETFEAFGFEPFVTPALEQADLLMGKYGPEAERLIYRARLGEDENLALRYDLTVPLARAVAGTPELPRPFRRYQVSPVWRGERPQRGRYREFVQADIDIVGSSSLLADAEIIALVVTVLARLGLTETKTKINNRKLVAAVAEYAGADERFQPGILRAVDKLDKIGLDGVRTELLAVGLPGEILNRARQGVGRWMRAQADADELRATLTAAGTDARLDASILEAGVASYLGSLSALARGGADDAAVSAAERDVVPAMLEALRAGLDGVGVLGESAIDRLLALLQIRGSTTEVLGQLDQTLSGEQAVAGLGEMRELLEALAASGVPDNRYELDFTMVRGLDYYTGTIFETVVQSPPVGSVTGGGRYDRLMGLFGRDVPAVGTSFGVDRLEDVLEAAGVLPPVLADPTAQVLVTQFDPASSRASLALASRLRQSAVRTELYLDPQSIGEQLGYAARRRIPLAVIQGPDEAASGQVSVRNLRRAVQTTVPESELVDAVRAELAQLG